QPTTETPAGLIGYNPTDNFYRRYTPASIRLLLQGIDGAGSGLDADFLRGMAPVRAGSGTIIPIADGTVVTNLNAQYLNNLVGSVSPLANTYVQREVNGYIVASYINMSSGDAGTAPTRLAGWTSDNYVYRYSAANVIAMLTTADGSGSGLDA